MELSVSEVGATGVGKELETAVLQEAIDECAAAGGGRVVFDPGTYLSGTLWLRDNVEIYLCPGATLQGSSDPEDYDDFTAPGFRQENAPEGTSKCLIAASEVDNIGIAGPGEINGAGPTFYDTDIPVDQAHYSKPDIPRPRSVLFYRCQNVRIADTAFVDSPCWTLWLVDCEDVRIRGIRVTGDQKMINNDGIDIDSCRNVTVSDSTFRTGDDCIVVRAIQQVLDDEAICEHVTVTNCVLDSTCQGIRLGCPSDNVIRHCVFSNLVIKGSGNGINIDNPRRYLHEDGARMDLHDVLFSNISIQCGRHPIRIFVEDGVNLHRLSDVSFSDIRARGRLPVTLQGCPETIISDVCFSNATLETEANEPLICRHCRRIRMEGVELR